MVANKEKWKDAEHGPLRQYAERIITGSMEQEAQLQGQQPTQGNLKQPANSTVLPTSSLKK